MSRPTFATVDDDTAEDVMFGFDEAEAAYLRRLILSNVQTVGACWEWQGHRSERGYADIKRLDTSHRAHRVSYAVFVQPFRAELLMCHTCDNPPCVNPLHLFPGDHAMNAQDAGFKGRLSRPGARGSTHPAASNSAETVRGAIQRYRRGETQRSIAADLGVTQSAVSSWVRGLTRKDAQ